MNRKFYYADTVARIVDLNDMHTGHKGQIVKTDISHDSEKQVYRSSYSVACECGDLYKSPPTWLLFLSSPTHPGYTSIEIYRMMYFLDLIGRKYSDATLVRQVSESLKLLGDSERQIIVSRYGLGDTDKEEKHTLASIGRRIGVTKQRAKQIEQHAMKRLKNRGPAFGMTMASWKRSLREDRVRTPA